MDSDKSKFRQVLVDVAEYDKNGNPIPLDSLSSGGARNADGSLIVQYSNPRLPESANEPDIDREFDERTSREYDARRRREEAAEERRRKENFERAILVIDKYVIPFTKTYVVPWATELWDRKVLPGGKRLAQRWIHPKRNQPEVPRESGSAPDFAAETENPPAASEHIADNTSRISTAHDGGEDTPLADVIQINKNQNRRSA